MRYSHASLFSFYATGLTALVLVAAILFLPEFARAESPATGGVKTPPKLARLSAPRQAMLGLQDEIAALESVQYALTQVADGSSYVWHRSHGMLSGVVQPTSSFKDAQGQVCRHIVVILNSLDTTSKTEAIACRMPDGIWQLDG